METIRAATGCHLRDYTNDDIPALVAILNQIYADEPTTVEQEQHWERTYPAGNPRLRRVAETEDGRMVGLTTLELLPNGIGITGTTGVLAVHRGRGVAAMIKLASLRYLKEQGYREARTHNDTANPPILALNEKLGYRRLPGWLAWEKGL